MLQLWFFYFFFPFLFWYNAGCFYDGNRYICTELRSIFRWNIQRRYKQHRQRTVWSGLCFGTIQQADFIRHHIAADHEATLPPIVNEAITLVKDTALVSALSVVDLMKATNSAVNRMTSLEPFFYAAVIYLIMTFILTLVAGRLEKYFSRYDAKEEWWWKTKYWRWRIS